MVSTNEHRWDAIFGDWQIICFELLQSQDDWFSVVRISQSCLYLIRSEAKNILLSASAACGWNARSAVRDVAMKSRNVSIFGADSL